jgi:general secretion pathway protein K
LIRLQQQHEQYGAAVVMALFVVVLCTLAVSPLIWNLFATAKTISVAVARDQADAVSRAGIDWARVILREDARISTTDTLTEPWAVPLAESRISESLMRRDESVIDVNERVALLSGGIEDAQGRFNLRNLDVTSTYYDQWLAGFNKLCDLLLVPIEQKALLINILKQMTLSTKADSEWPEGLILALHWEEFRGKYGLTEETWDQLRPYVIILPNITSVNANTASAEVLYAVIKDLSFVEAQRLLAQRERVTFRDIADIRTVVNANIIINNELISVSSQYFLVEGTAQVEEALIRTRALLERLGQQVFVIWRQ